MEVWGKHIVYYPLIEHPLYTERTELKRKYIEFVAKYADFSDEKELINSKLQVLYRTLFGKMEDDYSWENYTDQIETEILKTRFSPFKFFSYRYLFLFDCLLLFAVSDKEKGRQICSDFKTHVHRRYHKKIDNMISMMYEDDDKFARRTLISDDMVHAWIDARNYIKSHDREIVFTATMSAGKSTLINAIVGNSLSGAKKAACTSTVIKFHSLPAKSDSYTILDKEKCYYLRDTEFIKAYMKNSKTAFEVCGYFWSLMSKAKFTLVDTPGVNSSLHPVHKKVTRDELVSNCFETVVYVIPVETYGSEDDYSHLTYIKKKVSYSRILFVVNMMDTFEQEDDSVESILSDIREHLKEIGFQDPIVCPISAKAGLQLKRMLRGEELSENESESANVFQKLFSKPEYALGKYYPPINSNEKEEMVNRLYNKYDDKVWDAFVNTGLPGLEKILINL